MAARIGQIKYMLIALGVVFSLGIFVVAAQAKLSDSLEGGAETPTIEIKGLGPLTKVSYRIVPMEGEAVYGHAIANNTGHIYLPLDQLASLPGIASCDLSIENDSAIGGQSRPLNITAQYDETIGNIKFSASGLKDFSNVLVKNGDEVLQSKADWAGDLRALDLDLAGRFDQSDPLGLALHGRDWIQNVAGGDIPTIEVQFSLPFGGLSGAGVADNYVTALMMMTEQLSTVMMQQVMIIGTFFDAKHQLETQRELQRLQAEAHKDYYPSDQMCRFGSFVRDVAHSESKAMHDKIAINETLMARYLNKEDTSASEGAPTDFKSRIDLYRTVHCDPTDSNDGTVRLCENDNISGDRINRDIDFARAMSNPLTLDVDFRNSSGDADEQAAEQDIIALAKNLYAPHVLEITSPDDLRDDAEDYMDVRRLAAFQNIAHNSFVNYAGMKSRAPSTGNQTGGAHIKALMREFGVPDGEIEQVLGENPSYYAQMDVLTKKIYQSPDFYTNLYDKPTNVKRIGVSMQAITLMNARDHYESALRREMLLSLLVEDALKEDLDRTTAQIFSGLGGAL